MINRMPGFKGLCQKKNTEMMLKMFADHYPEFFTFCPKSFMIPEQLKELEEDIAYWKKENRQKVYIGKPTKGS